MSSDHGIRDELIRYAERGSQRAPADVLRSARNRAHAMQRRRRAIHAATAAVLVGVLVAGASVWRSQARQDTLVIADTSTSTTAAVDEAKLADRIEVPGRDPQVLGVAFGRIWVATVDPVQPTTEEGPPNASTVWTFDQSDGSPMASYHLDAQATTLRQTADAVIIRVSTGGPAIFDGLPEGGLGTNAVFRIDPSTDEVTRLRTVLGDGAIATTDDLIAVGDSWQVEVLDPTGAAIASVAMADVAGLPDRMASFGDPPISMQFANQRLFVVLGQSGLVARIDPSAGTFEMRTPLVAFDARIVAAVAWSGGFWVETISTAGDTSITPWTIDSNGTVTNAVAGEALGKDVHLIDVTAAGEAVTARASGDMDTVQPGETSTPAGVNSATSRLVHVGDQTWVAQSSVLSDAASTIEFRPF